MKQIYFSVAMFFIAAMSFAQQPVITAIMDGTCSGGTPKMLEIYADGTVDFSLYSVEIQTNANTTWGSTFNLGALMTRTDSFVYLTNTNSISGGTFATEFPNIATADLLEVTGNAINFNGDDRVRIIEDASGNVVDQFGVSDVRGTGQTWNYQDTYAKRNNGTGPDAGFVETNWTFTAPNALDNMCGTTTFETIVGIGSYTTVMSTTPALAITAPANGSTTTADVDVSFNVSNFTVAMSGGDGYVQYQLDGAAFIDKFDTTDISFTALSPGMHTVNIQLVDNTGAALSTPVTQSVTFTVPGALQVQDIAGLRAIALPSSDIITVAGEVFVTHTEGFRNQRWIQDASAGVLIDDDAGVVTTAIVRGDGLTGITGTLSEFGGLLQFTPTADIGAPTSTNNVVAPQVVTLAMLTTNAEDYESEIVQINGLSFDNADGTVAFSNGGEEPISVGTDVFVHRSLFNVDYIGLPLPTAPSDLVGFITQRTNGYSVQARERNDVSTLSAESVVANSFKIYPNPVNGGIVNITSSNGEAVDVVIYSTLGQKVLTANALRNELNVSNLDSGMYIVKISQGNATQTRKLVIK